MIVLVVGQALARQQIALPRAAAIVDRAAADLYRPAVVETDILDHEIADRFRRRDRLGARRSRG